MPNLCISLNYVVKDIRFFSKTLPYNEFKRMFLNQGASFPLVMTSLLLVMTVSFERAMNVPLQRVMTQSNVP